MFNLNPFFRYNIYIFSIEKDNSWQYAIVSSFYNLVLDHKDGHKFFIPAMANRLDFISNSKLLIQNNFMVSLCGCPHPNTTFN